MNNITITGNVGQAEIKNINGKPMLEFSLAVKKNFGEGTQWFKCTLWGERASKLSQYIVKGAGLAVIGEMNLNYNQEKKQSYPSVNVDKVDIIKFVNSDQPKQQNNYDSFQAMDESDEIPFF